MSDADESLLRLVWNPRDFGPDRVKLKGAAFARRDLIPEADKNGHPRYVSMDRAPLVDKKSVDWNLQNAKLAGKGAEKEKRIEPLFAEFGWGAICALEAEAGHRVFEVIEVPLKADDDGPGSPANPAHVGVRSLTPDPGDEDARQLKVDELRTLLLAARKATRSYSDLFGADPGA